MKGETFSFLIKHISNECSRAGISNVQQKNGKASPTPCESTDSLIS